MAEIHALYCIVDGEDEVFKVQVHTGDDIMDLKGRIYDKHIDPAYQVRSQRLTLWKVSTLTMSASMLQLTTLRSSTNHYASHPPTPWPHA
jgi:hypothetical protein